MSSPFLAAFEEQKSLQANYKEPAGAQQMDVVASDQKGDLKIVKYREEEAIFIQASHDRVTIIFSTVFKEETDRVYGRVFLQVSGSVTPLFALLIWQEFVDARRLQSLQNAPQVMYSNREPPLEIRHLPGLKNGEDWGYVTFGASSYTLTRQRIKSDKQSFSLDISPTLLRLSPPSTESSCSETTFTITSNAPKPTCTRGCDTESPNSSRFSTERSPRLLYKTGGLLQAGLSARDRWIRDGGRIGSHVVEVFRNTKCQMQRCNF